MKADVGHRILVLMPLNTHASILLFATGNKNTPSFTKKNMVGGFAVCYPFMKICIKDAQCAHGIVNIFTHFHAFINPLEYHCGDELNTSLKTASNSLHYEQNHEKYLYISDPIFTMLLAPEKKVILDFFSEHKVICLCVEFEVYPTPATGFLTMTASFWTNM